MKKFLMVALSLFLIIHLEALTYKGSVQEGIYYSPDGLFNVKIPHSSSCKKISDEVVSHVTRVPFFDEFGSKTKVEFYPIDTEYVPHLKDELIFTGLMKKLFDDYVQGTRASADTITKKEILDNFYLKDEKLGNLYFGSVCASNASDLYCVEEQNADAILGLLFSIESKHIILITSQLSPITKGLKKIFDSTNHTDVISYRDVLMKDLMKVRQSIAYFGKEGKEKRGKAAL